MSTTRIIPFVKSLLTPRKTTLSLPKTKRKAGEFKYRNGTVVPSALLNAITVVLDDANRSRRKYFLKQNDRYVEIFTTKRYREHQLGQLHYADETLVPIEATVVTTNDGAQNRYFEINSNDTVTEIYSPRAKDYLRTLESSYLPSSLLCKILLTCTKDNCTITHSLIQHAITKSNIPDLIRYTLNLDPDSYLYLYLYF